MVGNGVVVVTLGVDAVGVGVKVVTGSVLVLALVAGGGLCVPGGCGGLCVPGGGGGGGGECGGCGGAPTTPTIARETETMNLAVRRIAG